ncbi:MAG TPA: hypothetical protein VGL59_11875 [Polyangia bacterium]|jgi:hypothetical protein
MNVGPFVLFLLATVGLACGKSTNDGGYTAELQRAKATWASAKPTCPSYYYTATVRSFFGFCSETTIDIANDQPTRRSFARFDATGCSNGDAGLLEAWDELGTQQIDTHSDGAPALTVEGLFDVC